MLDEPGDRDARAAGRSGRVEVHTLLRVLESIRHHDGRSAEASVQQTANVNWNVWTKYRDVLLENGSAEMVPRAGGNPAPRLTPRGHQLLASVRGTAAMLRLPDERHA